MIRDSIDANPIGLSAQLKQASYLLLLLLKFKARRLPITILVLLLMPFNYWLFQVNSQLEINEQPRLDASSATSMEVVNASTFAKNWQVLVDEGSSPQAASSLRQIMANSGASNATQWLTTCSSHDECTLIYFRQLLKPRSRRKLIGRISFSKLRLQLECMDIPDTDLVCSFLYQLMMQSLSSVSQNKTQAAVFKEVQFVEYVGADSFNHRETFIRSVIKKQLSNTMCRRSLLSANVLFALWNTVLLHILIITAGCTVYFAATTVTFILGLKENDFLQLMFNSGLSVAAYWSVILCVTLLEAIIFASVFAMCYGVMCPDFFPNGAALRLLLIFWVFAYSQGAISLIATIVFRSYFVAVITLSAETLIIVAMSAIGTVQITQPDPDEPNRWDRKLLAMLIFPPGNIAQYSIYVLTPSQIFDAWGEGSKFYLDSILVPMVTFPIALTLLMIYLDFLLPTGNGYLLPPRFLLSRSFWLPGRLSSAQVPEQLEDIDESSSTIEPVVNGQPAIFVRSISMRYGSSCKCCCLAASCNMTTQALKCVTCTIYQNQITALIGHNGAGKTTLMRVLTGEETPTSGQAIIGGRTVNDPYQRLALRRQVSICKQENVLSPHLTVAESIELATISKGLTMASQQATVDDMMKRLGLSGKENVRAVDMSGGQLRKVCCIIALLGDPPVVMLDEPTSGLDPVSRRRLWQILQERKQNRCIILCTQFMDEADVLADRKLFLSNGQLICAGSSLFLKHMFGCSAMLNVSLRSEGDATPVLDALGKDVELVSQTKTELQLSVAQSSASALEALARAVKVLESRSSQVDAFGVSQANLDDIFTRLESIDPGSLDTAMKSKKLSTIVLSPEEVTMCRHPSLVGDGLGFSELKPSVGGTFVNLLAMNLRRQVRAPIQFLCRFFLPIAAIALLSVMVHLGKTKHISNQRLMQALPMTYAHRNLAENQSAGSRMIELPEGFRIPVLPSKHNLYAVCITDNGSVPVDCAAITGQWFIPVSMTKPTSMTLEDFLTPKSGKKSPLQQLCSNSSCQLVYANPWNSSQPNRNRNIALGRYGTHISSSRVKMPTYDLSRSLLGYFGAAKSLLEGVRLSTFSTLERFNQEQLELVVLAVLYSIIPVTFMTDEVEDRSSRVRQQMLVMGLSSRAYWINTFIIHWIQYAFFALLAMLVCLQWEKYQSVVLLCTAALPMLLVGTCSSILTVYCIGSCQQTTNNIAMTGYFFFLMIFCILSEFVTKSRLASAICIWLVPPMAPVLLCINTVKLTSYAMLYFDLDKADNIPELWTTLMTYPDTWHVLIAVPVHIALQLLFLCISESWDQPPPWLLYFQLLFGIRSRPQDFEEKQPASCSAPEEEEAGVSHERSRVERNLQNDANVLEVRRLEKVHPNGVKAVRGVTFGAGPGEIFGLLGQNGAGKTTLMSVVVGETGASSGEVEVKHGSAWIASVDGARHGAVGYCPQHNPLFDSVTVAEHMLFYAQIRGLPASMARVQSASLIEGLGLVPHQSKPAGHLSGGNKRRLCLALALLGSPSVVVIDEASSGVDPENKRAIWSAIHGMVSDGKRAVVVTTHSMEEVESLCGRVGIMNRGVMIGFGTVQQLRSRHGNAYVLEALVSSAPGDEATLTGRKAALKASVQSKFQDALVIEDICASVQFSVPITSVPRMSDGIQWLVKNQSRLEVQYFSLHQMSLDQVFVNMMRQHALKTGQSEMVE